MLLSEALPAYLAGVVADPMHPAWDHNAKLDAYALAAEYGLAVPGWYGEPVPLTDLRPPDVDRFVVKANEGCCGDGVHIMERQPSGLYLSGHLASWDTWLGWWADDTRISQQRRSWDAVNGPWWTEHHIGGPQVSTFAIRGVPVFVAVHDGPPSREGWATYTPEGAPLEVNTYTRTGHPFPGQEVIAGAAALAGHLTLPLVRIDQFADGTFQEITPVPGGKNPRWVRSLTPRLDRAWGGLWNA